MYLEKGDTDSATKWKRVMEEKQREDRKTRKDTWTPVWFHETEVPAGAVTMICAGDGNASSTSSSSTPVEFPTLKMWTYKGNFWEEREKREKNEVREMQNCLCYLHFSPSCQLLLLVKPVTLRATKKQPQIHQTHKVL